MSASSTAWKQANPEANRASAQKYHRSFAGRASNAHAAMRTRVAGKGKAGTAHVYKGLELIARAEFLSWAAHDPDYRRLHAAWADAGYPIGLSPSIDRKDTRRGYSRDNIRWIHSAPEQH